MHEAGFTPSKWNPCLHYQNSVIILIYIDDCIIFSPSDKAINKALQDTRQQGFHIDDQGDINDFLGIEIMWLKDGAIKLAQPQFNDSLITDLHLQHNTKACTLPALSTGLLHKDHDGLPDATRIPLLHQHQEAEFLGKIH